MTEKPNGNGFTTKEIVLRLEAKVDKVLANHETRLGSLEGFRNRLIGGMKVTGVLVGVLTVFVAPLVAILFR